ncbi:GNAT family N-acetyltransferase [Sphingomonas bacterium]|uniref:GNAT family N-acetyltransferase n=1 Tax=Sphingomonas bacterium TaxID=1895847 RepID=UPI001576CE80|nr:GNAT family N-acetyltransferase [Sphingomonas bacterium]
MTHPNAGDVRDDPAGRRYELALGREAAFAAYDLAGETITFTHTVVPPDRRGEGIATLVVRAALDDARRRGLGVVPQCPFVAAYINAHPETQDLLAAQD